MRRFDPVRRQARGTGRVPQVPADLLNRRVPEAEGDALDEPNATLLDRVGGREFFERLVDVFYDGVAEDQVLLPLYPEAPDLDGARHRLTGFLVQYWGGPTTYSDERGHPRLRMRHLPFHVGPLERDRWLTHMAAAVEFVCDDPSIEPDIAATLLGYFVPAAEHLRNDTGLPISSHRPT